MVMGSKEGGIGEARLLPSKWNKDNIAVSWRLDVDIYEGDDVDDEYSVVEEEEVDTSDSGSEEESVRYD